MKFRWHRGGLDDSMATIVEIEYFADLIAEISSKIDDVDPSDIRIKYYTYDERIGWDTYIVLLNGSPLGFTNGPI